MVSPDPDSRVWTLSIDSEVSSTAAYTSIRGPSVLSVGKSRFGWLISLLRVSFSLGVFYTAGCLLIRFACLGLHFFLPVVIFYSTAEEDLRHLFLECSFVRGLWDTLTSIFGHFLYLVGSVLDFLRESMRISSSTQLQSLWRTGIIFVLWVISLLCSHAMFRGCRTVFLRLLLWFGGPFVRWICPDWHDVEFN